MWKCGYRYLSCEKLHKICQLVPTLQIREQLVNICFFSAVSCSFLNASIHFLWTLNYAMTEYRVILLTANFSICRTEACGPGIGRTGGGGGGRAPRTPPPPPPPPLNPRLHAKPFLARRVDSGEFRSIPISLPLGPRGSPRF